MTQQPFSQQPHPTPARRLMRSRFDRKIAGVCAGIAEYFGADPTLIRILFVALAVLTGGTFVLAYLIAMVVMPDTPVA